MTTLLVVGDLHVNSAVAICPPEFRNDDGGKTGPSDIQVWLWEKWQVLISIAARIPDLITIFNGDICEGDAKDRSHQLITRNRADIVKMASATIEPLVKISKTCYLIRGTEAHTGKSGELEEFVAQDFDLPGPNKYVHSWWALPLSIAGRHFDISHEVTGGFGSPATRRNRANRLAFETVAEYANRGERPPDFVIRSHLHGLGDSYDNHFTRAIITPCWTFATSYVSKKMPLTLADIGAVFINVEKKEVWKFNPKPPKIAWVLPNNLCSKN